MCIPHIFWYDEDEKKIFLWVGSKQSFRFLSLCLYFLPTLIFHEKYCVRTSYAYISNMYDFKKWVAHVKRVMVNGASFDVYKQGRWCDLRFVLTIYFITQPKENEKKSRLVLTFARRHQMCSQDLCISVFASRASLLIQTGRKFIIFVDFFVTSYFFDLVGTRVKLFQRKKLCSCFLLIENWNHIGNKCDV